MSEERLQEIKDSVEFQREILEAHNMNTLCVDEEQELVEEIERLHSIIKEVREYLEEAKIGSNQVENAWAEDICDYILEILDKGEE